MKKRISAILIALAMVFTLASCTAKPTSSSSTTAQQQSSTPASGEVQKLVMTFITWTGAPADLAVTQEKINEILRPKFNAEVEMQVYDFGSYKQNLTLALAGGEQIDIMNGVTLGYPNLVAQGYLTDLEEDGLFEKYGSGIVDAIGKDFIDACRIGGTLYGVPQNRDMAVGRGCHAVATQYLDGIGYTAPADAGEIIKISEAELNDILAKINKKYPDIETYRPTTTNSFAQYTDIDMLGGNVFGVLLDYGKELKVENLFTSDTYMNYCKLLYDWNQKGYISQDAATDTTAVATLVKAGTLATYTTGGKPGSKAQESGMGVDMTIFQTKENFVASNAVASFPWTIPINSVNKELAMQVLNEFYVNPELSTLLIYGIKDTHYELLEDGSAKSIADANGNIAYATLGWLAPNQFIAPVISGNDVDLWEQTTKFNNTAKISAANGFTFDSSKVATEMAAVQNVYDEYQKSVEFGFIDPEKAIPEMNEKMINAGLQKIMDEKQTQLNAWAANK